MQTSSGVCLLDLSIDRVESEEIPNPFLQKNVINNVGQLISSFYFDPKPNVTAPPKCLV